MTTILSAANASCSIYGLEIHLENQLSALQQFKDAGLEPVTLVDGYPTIAVAIEYRDFTWDDLSNIQEYRSLVKSSIATKCTVGYVRKSNTDESDTTKKKLVNLQIYKMKTKLLYEDVFVSYNTSANDPIAERDATTATYTFEDCSGNTQDLIIKITKSARQIRLVVIDYAGLSTNPDDISYSYL
ncbi:hypothetical protein G6F37_008363 [Rhizopus arrhizus]|nr:hypothetical protein G6F38_007847 [Rhizopus arrhizus]KAG1155636.1 hypothetical protein G6F37_008363 [Rhizopus arrhizus]